LEKSSLKIFLPLGHDACLNRFLLAIIFLFVCAVGVCAEDERIWCPNVKINGQPVRMVFDTGSDSAIVLFSATVERLGLKVLPPDLSYRLKPGEVRARFTEVCSVDIGTTNLKTVVKIMELPSYLRGLDGVFGWPLFNENILQLDAVNHVIGPLQNVPDDSSWTRFYVHTNLDILALEVPGDQGAKAIVIVDTGIDGGIVLHPKRWRAWKTSHANQPTTLEASWMPGAGLVVKEESFVHEISLGSLMLTDVPIKEANQAELATDPKFEASLGLAALKRLDIVIDGKQGIAYLCPRKTPALPYEHNRLGAVFVPRNSQNDDLVAHVVPGSPAYESGIRNDDVLLKIGELDATRWRADPNVLPLSRFWNSLAGTRLELTLKRGNKVFKTIAVLRNILPPDAPKNSN
jgi:hypothetical protein